MGVNTTIFLQQVKISKRKAERLVDPYFLMDIFCFCLMCHFENKRENNNCGQTKFY